MSGEQRRLRNRLRAHARHRGDRVDARTGSHTIDHLVHEGAYEHWHGMLFARFLAENHLLIEPEMGVAITLDECEELAKRRRRRQVGAGRAFRAPHAAAGIPTRSPRIRMCSSPASTG